MIDLDQLCVDAGGRRLLDSVSLTARAGEVLAVLGPNGAGKSTLLKAVAGELQPHHGSVRLDGRLIADWTLPTLARRRATMRQDSRLDFAFSAREVVRMGRYPHGRGARADTLAIVDAALAAADATALAARAYPTLSGGEKARVQFARALAQIWPDATPGTRWLLLDEPTAALDLTHQHTLLAETRRRARDHGVCVLVVLHDLNLAARYADRVALLADGRLIACGSPATTLTAESLRAIWRVDADCGHDPDGVPWIRARAAA